MPRPFSLYESKLEQFGFAFNTRFRVFGDESCVISTFFATFQLDVVGFSHNAQGILTFDIFVSLPSEIIHQK